MLGIHILSYKYKLFKRGVPHQSYRDCISSIPQELYIIRFDGYNSAKRVYHQPTGLYLINFTGIVYHQACGLYKNRPQGSVCKEAGYSPLAKIFHPCRRSASQRRSADEMRTSTACRACDRAEVGASLNYVKKKPTTRVGVQGSWVFAFGEDFSSLPPFSKLTALCG